MTLTADQKLALLFTRLLAPARPSLTEAKAALAADFEELWIQATSAGPLIDLAGRAWTAREAVGVGIACVEVALRDGEVTLEPVPRARWDALRAFSAGQPAPAEFPEEELEQLWSDSTPEGRLVERFGV